MNAAHSATACAHAPARDVVTIPAMKIMDVDLLDGARDKLRTIHLALSPENKGWQDGDALFAIWATVNHVMNDLDHLRDYLCERDRT